MTIVEIRNNTKAKFYIFTCRSEDSGIIYVDIFDKKPKEDMYKNRVSKVGSDDYDQPTIYTIKSNKVIGVDGGF